MSKVSIIIPAYNAGGTVGRALDGILSNAADMDIVVVDDASTDNTSEVVQEYSERYSNIRLIRNETNTGPGIARNRALATIDSEYCMFQDADDKLDEGAIDTVLALMDDNLGIDLGVFRYSLLESADGVPVEDVHGIMGLWNSAAAEGQAAVVDILNAPLFLMVANYPWNKVFRTSFIQRVNLQFSNTRINEDLLPHWVAHMNARQILVINLSLTAYSRIPESGQLTKIYDERRLEIFKAFKDVEMLFEENFWFREAYYPAFLLFKWQLLRTDFRYIDENLHNIFHEYVRLSYQGFTDDDFRRIYERSPDAAMISYRLKYAPSTLTQ